jgi:hypothetical protein
VDDVPFVCHIHSLERKKKKHCEHASPQSQLFFAPTSIYMAAVFFAPTSVYMAAVKLFAL